MTTENKIYLLYVKSSRDGWIPFTTPSVWKEALEAFRSNLFCWNKMAMVRNDGEVMYEFSQVID